jgi:carbonic anhydrase
MSRNGHPIQRMLTANAQWAEDVLQAEPSFFEESAKGQSPHVRREMLVEISLH